MIRLIKKYINKSEFTKNALTLVTGTTIAQILPIAISPILTRIYSPEDFGVLAVFMSIVIIFGTIANGRYELAIILPKEKSDAINIFILGLIISTTFSIFLFIITIIFHNKILLLIGNEALSFWIYIIPFVVFMFGLFNMLNFYNTRIKKYKSIAQAKVLKSIGMVAIQLGLFFTKNGVIALLTGYSMSNIFGNIKLLTNITKDKELLKKINKNDIKHLAKRYIRFPKLTLPATLANKLSSDLINILISTVFSVSTLGFYSLANRILAVPSSFIGASVSQVFLQEATDEKKKTGVAIKTFKNVVIKLTAIALPFFTLIFFISEWLFAFVFGEEWRIAGSYAKIITPLLLIRFVVAPVSVSLSIFEKQHISLLWQIGLFILALGSLAFSFYSDLAFYHFLYIFVFILFIYYFFFLIILYWVVRGKF